MLYYNDVLKNFSISDYYIPFNVIGAEKGTLHTVPDFSIKNRLYLKNHSSYEVELWHEYSSIILLHLQNSEARAHFLMLHL